MRRKSSTVVHLSNTDYNLKRSAISYKFAKNRQKADKRAMYLVHPSQKFFWKFLCNVIKQYRNNTLIVRALFIVFSKSKYSQSAINKAINASKLFLQMVSHCVYIRIIVTA